jgi:PIN domain nuclease of toxin-antitoxin system
VSWLLDTHTLLWLLENNPSLSETARQVLAPPEAERFVSIASFWELSIKVSLGKLQLQQSPANMMRLVPSLGIQMLPLRPEHLEYHETLPFHHRDPFDRLLIATAIVEELTLVSADRKFKDYGGLKIIW